MKMECPLVNGVEIEDYECLENADVADGIIKEDTLPSRFKIKDWRSICAACSNRKYLE